MVRASLGDHRKMTPFARGGALIATTALVLAPEDLSLAQERDRSQAAARLETFLERLSAHSEVLTSEVGGHDPFAAVSRVMERCSFDEIIISTLPATVSRWLKMDLPSRVERAFSVPVVVINPN